MHRMRNAPTSDTRFLYTERMALPDGGDRREAGGKDESSVTSPTVGAPAAAHDEVEASTAAPIRRPRRGRGLDRGTLIGRYVIIDPIGKGGMGTVCAAYDPELDRRI